jgi:hypothetical protein
MVVVQRRWGTGVTIAAYRLNKHNLLLSQSLVVKDGMYLGCSNVIEFNEAARRVEAGRNTEKHTQQMYMHGSHAQN